MQNFGNINNAFNEILIDGITKQNPEYKKLYQKYLKRLSENEVLKTQYLVFKNLESRIEPDSTKALDYVKENISLMRNFSMDEIENANKSLMDILGENEQVLNIEYNNKELHENISFLINNPKTASNIDKVFESRNVVSDYIITNEEKEAEEIMEVSVPTKVLAEVAIKKFNEKYSVLDDNTKAALKLVIESDGMKQETFFNESVRKCVDLVNENLKDVDTETATKLLDVKDKLLRMEYEEKTFAEDVVRVINLLNDLTE